MVNINLMGKVERAAYAEGLRVGTWHPGDGATRYRFFRETASDADDADYFGGSNPLITVLGRKAAFAFIEAYRLGRIGGIREASAEVINGATHDQSPEQIGLALVNLINRGPWHFGGGAS